MSRETLFLNFVFTAILNLLSPAQFDEKVFVSRFPNNLFFFKLKRNGKYLLL